LRQGEKRRRCLSIGVPHFLRDSTQLQAARASHKVPNHFDLGITKENMKKVLFFLAGGFLLILSLGFRNILAEEPADWGFWGHRRLNRMAVFTLPPDMISFFKKHVEYLTEHAVDPDKRRYATRHEAVRHYIDIDHWGTYPFPDLPRNWVDALIKYTEVSVVTDALDTLRLTGEGYSTREEGQFVFSGVDVERLTGVEEVKIPYRFYKEFFSRNIMPQYYEDQWILDCEEVQRLFTDFPFTISCTSAYAVDHFSEYGILPYNMIHMQERLTKAFRSGDKRAILRLCADFGHYIGDGHVPLHTTENYNGQLTNQVGIHAFWESRLPELFADENYDFFVGKSEYITDIPEYYWDIVLTSHSYVDSVLSIEKRLSKTYPQAEQYCFEERLGRNIRTQCTDYARAYHNALDGMVEKRMRATVRSIGSAWYTAWVDAGQPDLMKLEASEPTEEELQALREEEVLILQGKPKGRVHKEY
jgi:hypothetical protein